MSGPVTTPNTSDDPTAGRARARFLARLPRRRRGELALGVGLALALPLSLFAVTGYIPGLFPPSPYEFSQSVPTCSFVGERTPSVTEALPAWANVRLSWRVQTSPNDLVLYTVTNPNGWIVYFAGGTNGTGSFTSEGGAYSFSPSFFTYNHPPANSTCGTVVVTLTITYSPI